MHGDPGGNCEQKNIITSKGKAREVSENEIRKLVPARHQRILPVTWVQTSSRSTHAATTKTARLPEKRQRMKTNYARCERSGVPSLGPSCARCLDGIDEGDSDPSNTGDPELWDPNAGSKPSPQDDWGLDGEVEVEEDLPYGGVREMNSAMIDMMIELGDYDEHDGEWLSAKEQSRLEAKKKGKVSFPSYE
jgi:hypothetical protein